LGRLSEDYATGLTVHDGNCTTIDVPFSGATQLSVTWKCNGQELPDGMRMTARTVGNRTSLTLNHVQSSHTGTYSLLLESSAGKVSFYVHVKVIGKCVISWNSFCSNIQSCVYRTQSIWNNSVKLITYCAETFIAKIMYGSSPAQPAGCLTARRMWSSLHRELRATIMWTVLSIMVSWFMALNLISVSHM